MMSLPRVLVCSAWPLRSPSPAATIRTIDTMPHAIPNMVRNVRSLCDHRVRKTSAMRSRKTMNNDHNRRFGRTPRRNVSLESRLTEVIRAKRKFCSGWLAGSSGSVGYNARTHFFILSFGFRAPEPVIQFCQRQFALHFMPLLPVANLSIQRRQEIVSYVGRLKLLRISMRDVIQQRSQGCGAVRRGCYFSRYYLGSENSSQHAGRD